MKIDVQILSSDSFFLLKIVVSDQDGNIKISHFQFYLIFLIFSWSTNQADLASIPAKGVISSQSKQPELSGDDGISGIQNPHQILETKGKTGKDLTLIICLFINLLLLKND